jgi:hypothetical protein
LNWPRKSVKAGTGYWVSEGPANQRSITKGSIDRGGSETDTPFTPPKTEGELLQMYMLIRFVGGIIVEGVLLAKGRDRLRVAASGFPETIELRRSGSRWITSGHVQVEFDFLLMSDEHQAESVYSSTAMGAAMVV